MAMEDIEHACDKIRMGHERKSAFISEENKKMTAYHEGGHALVALYTDGDRPTILLDALCDHLIELDCCLL